MTTQQLRHLYDFAGLPFSMEAGDFAQLKKILLLELKSTGDEQLLIDRQVWDKNSLLQLFDSGLPDSEINIEAFEEQHPWISFLRSPLEIEKGAKITPQLRGNSVFQHFVASESLALFPDYKRALKLRMDENDLMLTHALLTYLPVFSDEHQFEIKELVKALLRGKYKTIDDKIDRKISGNAIAEERFFYFPVYYDILKLIAHDDDAFLMYQLDLFRRMLKITQVTDAKRIARLQIGLPLSADAIAWLRQLMDKVYRTEAAALPEHSVGSNGRSVWVIIGIVIVVIRLLLLMARH